MAKSRRRAIPGQNENKFQIDQGYVQNIQNIERQMRGLIEATRAPRARRFVTPSKVQARINELINQEVSHNERQRILRSRQYGNSGKRSAPREVYRVPENGRNTLHKSPVLQQRLRPEVRDVLRDSERALEWSRRETRREVIFAMQRAGKGGRKNKKARWTADSYITCKR